MPAAETTRKTPCECTSWAVERRKDGAVLVRVPSKADQGVRLPDAVFSFRAGDPQFSFWEEQLRQREQAEACNSQSG